MVNKGAEIEAMWPPHTAECTGSFQQVHGPQRVGLQSQSHFTLVLASLPRLGSLLWENLLLSERVYQVDALGIWCVLRIVLCVWQTNIYCVVLMLFCLIESSKENPLSNPVLDKPRSPPP